MIVKAFLQADMEVQILVEALFHERTAYPDKSQARSLFEKVQVK